MMGGGMMYGSLFGVLLLLGFAYIIWVLSSKEDKATKTVGQIIAIVIAVVAVIVLLYGKGSLCGRGYKGSHMKKGMKGAWMTKKMMRLSDKERQEMMDGMMKNPKMRKEMEECLKKQ